MLKTNNTKRIITIILTCIFIICAIVLLYEFVRIANLKNKQKQLESNLTAMQQEIYDYSQKNTYYSNRENYLEEYAREVYNWGKTDRTYFE